MKKSTKALSNLFFMSFDWVAAMGLGYLFWFAMGKTLPPHDVGIFSTIINTSIFVSGFATLGLSVAIVRLIPHYYSLGKLDKIAGIIWWTFKIVLFLTLLISLLVGLGSGLLSSIGYLSLNQGYILAIMILVMTIYQLTASYLFSLQEMARYTLSNIFASLLKLVFAVGFIYYGFNYLGPVLGVLLSFVLISLVRLYWMPRGSGSVDESEILKYAMPAFVGGIGAVMMAQGHIIVLSAILTPSSVGLFTMAMMLGSLVQIFPNIIGKSIFPITSQQFTEKQDDGLNKLLSQSVKHSLVLSIPLMIIFIIFSPELMLLISGPEFAPASVLVPFLAVGFFVFSLATIFLNTLYVGGFVNESRNIWILAGLMNVILVSILALIFGILGGAVGFFVSNIFIFFISGYLLAKKVGLSFDFWVLGKVILTGLGAFGLIFFAKANFDLLLVVFLTPVIFLLYFVGLLYLNVFNSDDFEVIKIIKKKVSSLFLVKSIICA